MKITEDVRKYAAELGIAEEAAEGRSNPNEFLSRCPTGRGRSHIARPVIT
jgi:hypothetical protein